MDLRDIEAANQRRAQLLELALAEPLALEPPAPELASRGRRRNRVAAPWEMTRTSSAPSRSIVLALTMAPSHLDTATAQPASCDMKRREQCEA
jgi:hypothetical protein